MLDIDYFKNINDTCRYAVGDDILVQLSLILQSRIELAISLPAGEVRSLLPCYPIQLSKLPLPLQSLYAKRLRHFSSIWMRKELTSVAVLALLPSYMLIKALTKWLRKQMSIYTTRNGQIATVFVQVGMME